MPFYDLAFDRRSTRANRITFRKDEKIGTQDRHCCGGGESLNQFCHCNGRLRQHGVEWRKRLVEKSRAGDAQADGLSHPLNLMQAVGASRERLPEYAPPGQGFREFHHAAKQVVNRSAIREAHDRCPVTSKTITDKPPRSSQFSRLLIARDAKQDDEVELSEGQRDVLGASDKGAIWRNAALSEHSAGNIAAEIINIGKAACQLVVKGAGTSPNIKNALSVESEAIDSRIQPLPEEIAVKWLSRFIARSVFSRNPIKI